MRHHLQLIMLFILLTTVSAAANAHEFTGYAALEGRVFFNDAQFAGQKSDSLSISLQTEYYHEWRNGSSFTLVPFARLDSVDSERSHFDLRELNYLWLADDWELRLGVGKVFWGTTEFVHLVDIINQTDFVEGIAGETKLGQPMVHLSVPKDWGTLDLFLLPGFRERTFPGREGRLRSNPVVDTERSSYESSRNEQHIDIALRYSHTLGDWDFGLYHFRGTGREPTLQISTDDVGRPILVTYYEQITQTGLDLQMVAGEWLWKLEALQRSSQADNYFASVGGFEYTFVRVAESDIDLGIIGEMAWDERGDEATSANNNDAMLGLRLALNDAAGSELLLGYGHDLDNSACSLSVEGSRRIGDNFKLSLEGRFFDNVPDSDLLASLRDDDYFQVELKYFF